ncbi:MAG TPA: hypothetical protein VEC38_10320 [Candidatus Binataceae bacterium]|nr:hypothetical protein [Candidatus Binataceae bacterium]
MLLLGWPIVMKKVLMVCTGNMDRSPTAAMVLAEMCAPMWVTSAGTESWAKNKVSLELVEEADVICVMEDAHRRFILSRFGDSHAEKVVVLDIPDNYICGEAELIHLLKGKLRAALGLLRASR